MNIGTLAAFVIVCLGVIVLRYRQPDLPRPFKTPFMPLIPLLGMGFCLVFDHQSQSGDLVAFSCLVYIRFDDLF